MPEQPKNSRSRIPLYILIVLLYLFVTFQGDEKSVLSESVSGESDFQVYLTEGVSYELWVENPEGPDKIDVIISNGELNCNIESSQILSDPLNHLISERKRKRSRSK